jgi:hypothetical protein
MGGIVVYEMLSERGRDNDRRMGRSSIGHWISSRDICFCVFEH